jgi:hypothetical protein
MIIAGATNNTGVIASHGVATTTTFSIARTPHMFRVLSSGLYSDKIGAVLREIGANAQDAHIMAGKPDLPFEVKMPSALDRIFYIKDYGIGLDDLEIRQLYTTYGYSSKQHSDEVTGAFGLGSKSPFAYTLQNPEDADGFTVESVKDGVKRIYTCYLDEAGTPSVSLLHSGEAEPDWTSGVKVTFPVQAQDITEFHDKAREIFRWFKVTPTFLGLSYPLSQPEFKLSGSFFGMDDRYSSLNTASVVMGNVRYPIHKGRLRDMTDCERALLAANVVLYAPIGSVMMTPSREDLEYTERTRATLKALLEKAAVEVAQTIKEKVVNKGGTRWAWLAKVQEYYSSLPVSVQAALPEFLRIAGLSTEERLLVTRHAKEAYLEVPLWIGDGDNEARRTYLRDSESGLFLRDAQGELIGSEIVPGCRVWVYRVGTSGIITRKEVLSGHVRAKPEAVRLQLPYLEDVRVVISDAKQANIRVRESLKDKAKLCLLVVPGKDTDAAFVEAYAKKMTSEEGVDGLPLDRVSDYPMPAHYAEKQKQRKRDKAEPTLKLARTEVDVLGIDGSVTVKKMGELSETEKFFLFKSGSRSMSRVRLYNGNTYLPGYRREGVLKAIERVMAELGVNVTGAVLIKSEATAKRLKFSELNIQPLLPTVQSMLEDEANWKKIVGATSSAPLVNFDQMYTADDYGWLGILGYHAVKGSPFWSALSSKFIASPIVSDVLEFVENAQEAKALNGSQSGKVLNAVDYLLSNINNFYLNRVRPAPKSCHEVKSEFFNKYPAFQALNESWLMSRMDEAPAAALSVMGAMLAVDNHMAVVPQALFAVAA